ncbi:MAG: YerC/YecD family TrpR-related protein [Clostridia bacterium]
MKDYDELIDNLYKVIIKIENVEDCKAFFEDLCTYKEVEQMAQRLEAAKLLLDNQTYTQVTHETDISSATLSRVSKCIQHGSGGYKKFAK